MSDKENKQKKSALESLVGRLSDDVVRKKLVLPGRKAFMSYDIGSSTASSYDQFVKTGSGFVKHYMAGIGMGSISDDQAQSLFHKYAGKAFEQEGGVEAAYEAARKDLFAVMQKLSGRIDSEQRNAYIQSVLGSVDPTDFDAHKAIAADVVGGLSGIHPGLKSKKPEALAHNWRSLALNYAGMRDNAQNLVGDYKAA